jgi:hypothetical protein
MGRPAPLVLLLFALNAVEFAQAPPIPPGVPAPALIHGQVISYVTGDRLRHVRVAAAAASGAIPATLTDENGVYTLGALPRGRYTVTVTKPGYVKQTSTVTVSDSSRLDPLDFALVKGAVISGALLDDLGEPVPAASVGVGRVAFTGSVLRVTTVAIAQTDDTGAFRVAGLPPGDNYVVEITPGLTRDLLPGESMRTSGPTAGPRMFYPGTSDVGAAGRIALGAGDARTGITFTLPPRQLSFLPPPPPPMPGQPALAAIDSGPASDGDAKTTAVIKGRILRADGGALQGVQVMALFVASSTGTRSPRPPMAAASGPDGSFELTVRNVFAGDHLRLTATKTAYQAAEYGQRTPGTRGDPIAVNPGEVHEHFDIVLQRLGVIAGRIVDDLGEPVEGAAVRPAQLRYVNGRRQLVDVGAVRRTDDLGRYRLFGLRLGQYAVSASVGQIVVAQPSADLPGYGTTYFPGVADPQAAQFVRVDAAEDAPAVDFSLARMKSARVAGKAIDAEGNPVTGGIALMPSLGSGASTEIQMGARIDRDGAFEFPNVPPGDYVLQVVHGRSKWNEGEFAYRFVSVTDSDVTGLEMQTSTGSALTGRISTDGGEIARLDEVELSAFPVDIDRSQRLGGPPGRAHILPDGQFELLGISGPRRLQVVRAPSGWMMRSILVRGVDVTDQILSFGRDDQSLEDIEVVLTNRVTQITGSVGDARGSTGLGGQEGRGSDDLAVLAFATDRDQWYQGSRFRRRVAAADGRFRIEGLPPADYFVVAAQPPRDPGEWQDPDVLEKLSREAARVRLMDGQRVSLTLKPSVY